MDSNRVADNTVLPRSLMGLKRGERHTAHRQQMKPALYSEGRTAGRWPSGRGLRALPPELEIRREPAWQPEGRPASLEREQSGCLPLRCGVGAAERTSRRIRRRSENLRKRSASGVHPFFVRWLFPVRASRARVAYRYLFNHLKSALERRLHQRCARQAERARQRRGDVLGTLVNLKLQPPAGKASWSHEEGVEELISLVAGGTDAMSYTMAQALYLLSQNADLQDEARARVFQTADTGTSQAIPSCSISSTKPCAFSRPFR